MALRLEVPVLGPFDAERLLAADVSLVEVDDLVDFLGLTSRHIALLAAWVGRLMWAVS